MTVKNTSDLLQNKRKPDNKIYGIPRILLCFSFPLFDTDSSIMKMDPRVRLSGVIIECPFGTPLENCVFNPIRQRDLSARMRWLSTLAEKKKEQLATIHDRCISQREKIFWGKSGDRAVTGI